MSNSALPGHWQTVAIKDIASVTTGTTPSTQEEQFWGGSIPFITPAELNGSYIVETQRTITEAGLRVSRPLPRGAVAVSCIGYIGKVGVVNAPVAVTNQQINSVIPVLDKADSWFLAYLFQKLAPRLRNCAGVTTVPILNKGNFESFQISLPPLLEQRAIAAVLRAIQEAKEARQRELILERERKAALMQYLFTHGTRGERRKQTEIGKMPESWRVALLGSLASLITKGSSPNWQGFEYCRSGIVFVRSQNVGLGRLELDEIAHLPESFNAKEKKSILKADDLLINIVGASIGRAALANELVAGGNINQAVALVRLDNGSVPAFLMDFLHCETGQSQLHRQKKDIARANLSLQDIANLSVPVPSTEEQAEIAAAIAACENQISSIEKETTLLEELFQAMLEELMTGRLSSESSIEVDVK